MMQMSPNVPMRKATAKAPELGAPIIDVIPRDVRIEKDDEKIPPVIPRSQHSWLS